MWSERILFDIRGDDYRLVAAMDFETGNVRIGHVRFKCAGIEAFVRRFEAAGVPFSERQAHDQAHDQALSQLLVRDRSTMEVELNFAAAEACGGRPPDRAHRRPCEGEPRPNPAGRSKYESGIIAGASAQVA